MIKINNIDIKEEYAVINIDSPTHGHFDILIDLEDVEKCKDVTWSIQMIRCRKNKEFITFYATNHKLGMLHRYLVNAPKGLQVDHKDGNTYDNRKSNIRVCSQEDNNKNQAKYKNNKSGHVGVIWYYYRDVNKWWAYISLNFKKISLGYYDKLEDAIEARRKGEIKYFGEYSRNNGINT